MSTSVDKHTRISVSPRLRMEVFKRDGFTCRYCGRQTPEVILEVDHIIPVAEGGASDIENLATACWECNRGKGAGLLDDRAPVTDMHEQAVMMAEREIQLKEYNRIKHDALDRETEDMEALYDYWRQLAGYPTGWLPYENVLRAALKRFPAADIREAMTIAFREDRTPEHAVRYLSGILKNWREQGKERKMPKDEVEPCIELAATRLSRTPRCVEMHLKQSGPSFRAVVEAVLIETAMCLGHLEGALCSFYAAEGIPQGIFDQILQIQRSLPGEIDNVIELWWAGERDASTDAVRVCIRRMRDLLDHASGLRFAYEDEQ